MSGLPQSHKLYVSLLYKHLLRVSKKAFPSASRTRKQYIRNEIIDGFRNHKNETDIHQIAALVNEGNLHLKRMIISIDKPFVSDSIKDSLEDDDLNFDFNFQKYDVINNKIVMTSSHSILNQPPLNKNEIKEDYNVEETNNNNSSKIETNNEEIINSNIPEKIIKEVKLKSESPVKKQKSIPIIEESPKVENINTKRQKIKNLVDINQLTNHHYEKEYKKKDDIVSPSSVIIKQLENENFNVPKLKSERNNDEFNEDPVLPNKYVLHAVKDQCTVLIPENVK